MHLGVMTHEPEAEAVSMLLCKIIQHVRSSPIHLNSYCEFPLSVCV